MSGFINGAIMMEFIIAGVFFLRFWRRTRDQLFLMFALGFGIMAVNRLFLDLYTERGSDEGEHRTLIYGVRLLAFGMFLLGILIKNRRASAAFT
jgi:low temperature requirement protein LtrA